MDVRLISYTPEPERTVAAAARLCYSSKGAGELFDDLTDKEVVRLIKKLQKSGHKSPFEHAKFTFAVQGVSRVLSHQLVRHRIASYSQKSQRYVSETDFDFIIPPSIAADAAARELFMEKMEELQRAYDWMCKNVAKEDARYLLPNATETKIVVTMNASSLFNFFTLRCCDRAQWEIRELAWKMLELVREVAPNMFKKAGPNCMVKGECYEGDFSCGRIKTLKE